MRKKGKLYTANKWNQPLFMPRENRFDFGSLMSGISTQETSSSIPQQGYKIPTDNMPAQSTPVNTSTGGGFNWGNVGKGAATAASFIPAEKITLNEGQDNQMDLQRGAWDMLDPMYWVTGGQNGYKSSAGEGMSNTAVTLTKTGMPWLMLTGAALKIGADVVNAVSGVKTDENLESQIKGNTAYLQNFNSNAGSYEGLVRATPSVGYQDVYDFNHKWANRKTRRKVREQNAALKQDYDNAVAWADNSYLNNLHNIQQNQVDNALRNYSAYGGPIDITNNDDNMSAINYGFMVDYLAAKQKQAEAKNNNMTNMFAGMPATMFAKGGGIHINPKNKGKFNATKKRTGKTTEQLTHSKNPLTRKRAIFAQNARKWHHADGGPMNVLYQLDDRILALGGDIQTHGGDYSIGKIYDVSEKEANRLKNLGYEFTIVS